MRLKVFVLAALISLTAAACDPHSPPRADAGEALSLEVDEVGFLTGFAVDPDGDRIVSWSWAIDSAPAGSTPELGDPTSQETGFVADRAGEYVVSLVVSDREDSSRPDLVTVTVSARASSGPLPVPALGSWGIVGAAIALLAALLPAAARRGFDS